MEESRHCTTQPQVSDSLSFVPIPKAVSSTRIKDLYLKNGLTAAQIGSQIGLSKAAVLNRLHAMGIRSETLEDVLMDTSRPAVPAHFGQRVVAGTVVDCRRELSVVQYIVELQKRQGLRWKKVAECLNRDGHRTRTGLLWKVGTAKMVFDRWNGKV